MVMVPPRFVSNCSALGEMSMCMTNLPESYAVLTRPTVPVFPRAEVCATMPMKLLEESRDFSRLSGVNPMEPCSKQGEEGTSHDR